MAPPASTFLTAGFVAFPLLEYGLRSESLLLDNDPTQKQQLNTGSQLPKDRRLPHFDVFGNQFHLGVVLASLGKLDEAAAQYRRYSAAGSDL